MAAAELQPLLQILELLPVRDRLREGSSPPGSWGPWCNGISVTACGRCSRRARSTPAACSGSSPRRRWPPSGSAIPSSTNCPCQRWSFATSPMRASPLPSPRWSRVAVESLTSGSAAPP